MIPIRTKFLVDIYAEYRIFIWPKTIFDIQKQYKII